MRLILWCGRTLLFSLVAAIVGGFVAGASLMTVGIASDPPSVSSVGELAIFFVWFLPLALMAGMGGIWLGLQLGFVPTLIFGASLSALRHRWPFSYGATWATIGAAAGLAMHYLFHFAINTPLEWSWAGAWVVGGATCAWTYWGLDTGMFAGRGFGWIF